VSFAGKQKVARALGFSTKIGEEGGEIARTREIATRVASGILLLLSSMYLDTNTRSYEAKVTEAEGISHEGNSRRFDKEREREKEREGKKEEKREKRRTIQYN